MTFAECDSSSGAIMLGLQCFSREQTCSISGGDGRFQATYDCIVIEINRLEPCDSHIIFLNNGFICIMDMLNI